MIVKLKDILLAIYRIFWGKPYYRYSALMLTVGAGLLAGPDFWEAVLELLIWVFGTIYKTQSHSPVIDLGSSIMAQIVGAILLLLSVIVFVTLHLKDQKEAKKWGVSAYEVEDLRYLRELWRNLRDIRVPPNKPNLDDVSMAINAVNESGKIIAHSPSILARCKESFGEFFCIVYQKLITHKYKVCNLSKTSDQQISTEAHGLYKQMRRGTNESK